MKKKKTTTLTGQNVEWKFGGGHFIDIDAQFVSSEGVTFTIKLDDEQFKKLKEARIGTTVKVTLI